MSGEELLAKVLRRMLMINVFIVFHAYGRPSYENVFRPLGTNVILNCPYTSKRYATKWLGPPKFTPYTYKSSVTRSLPHFERLKVIGNSSVGEYNLEIRNFSHTDEGFYRCISVNESGLITHDLKLQVYSKPEIQSESNSLTFTTTTGYPVNVSILADSVDKPIALWTHSPGGTRGIWTVEETANMSSFLMSSSVVPESYAHFGNYGVRLRNKAGSVDISLNVVQSRVPVRSVHSVCNMSSSIILQCLIDTKVYTNWTTIWKHYINNVFLRSFPGSKANDETSLHIPFCHPRDEGEYICVLVVNNTKLEAKTLLTVNGPPIVVNTSITYDYDAIELSVVFRSTSGYLEPLWYYRRFDTEQTIDTNSDKYNQSVKETPVHIVKYNVNVVLPGYAVFFTVFPNEGVEGTFICQLRNTYGAVEISFDVTYNMVTTVNSDIFSTGQTETLTSHDLFLKYSLLLPISCAAVFGLAVTITSLYVRKRLRKRRKVVVTGPQRQISVHLEQSEGIHVSPNISFSNSEEVEEMLPYLHEQTLHEAQTYLSSSSSSGYEIPDTCTHTEVPFSYEMTDMTKAETHLYETCIDAANGKEGTNSINDRYSWYSIPGHPYFVVLEPLGKTHTLSNVTDNINRTKRVTYKSKRSQSI